MVAACSADALEAALRASERKHYPALPGRTNHLPAGVLVPLLWGDDPELVLTERPKSMRRHAGQTCFPGGQPAAGDLDVVETALREAREEIGVTSVRVLGRLSSVPLYGSDFRLEPTVGLIDGAELRADEREVARLFRLSVRQLLDVPQLDGLRWEHQGEVWLLPIFELGDAIVFGGTALVLHELLEHLAAVLGQPMPPIQEGSWTWSSLLERMQAQAV